MKRSIENVKELSLSGERRTFARSRAFGENASWITCPKTPKGAAVVFYKKIFFANKVNKALLSVSSVGVYEVYLNGEKIDDHFMKPGYTSYKNRLQYQTFSVAEKLCGEVEISVEVAPGWAVGRAMYPTCVWGDNLFSDHTAAIAEIVGEYEDGTTFAFSTDESWNARSSETLFSDLYDGETVDFTAPAVEYGSAVKTRFNSALVKQKSDGVVENERLKPASVFLTPKGEKVIDFGQNMTGVVEFVVEGKRGDRISFSCAEVLDKDGNFYTANYRTAKSKVTYVLDGQKRILKSKFTFQGFRYICLDECPEGFFEEAENNVRAIVLHTKLKRTGRFVCGNPKVNQLYHNIIWGQKSNYLDIPTDCPQRDERLGWTGDAQVFCRAAAYNYDVRKFFRKWLEDVRLEQTEKGEVLSVVPHLINREFYSVRTSAGWGDCITIIPSELYEVYGDKRFLSDNFEAMRRWVEYIRGAGDNEYLWLGGYHYGDWLAMDEGMEDSYVGATSNDLIATAFYAHSVELLINAGKTLGKDMSEYERLLKNIKKEFRAYFMPNGEFLDDYPLTERVQKGKKPSDTVRNGLTQTALTLILKFGLCEEEDKAELVKKLDELIEKNGGRMSTGFLGTPYLLQALTENGYVKRAYDVFFREDNPSWLYSVDHGATTIWEHWNSIKEDGSFWSTDMNSFNHYAYGAVGAWIYETVAGIKTAKGSAGFEKITLAPVPDRRLGFVKCSVKTVRGRIVSEWSYEGEGVRFSFTVPKGVEADICLPDGFKQRVKEGKFEYFIKQVKI
ncbi:MAG: family 78 glycoside hydrolase catalytic domain [Clostridia bacterium]|nr:family 78 glycoside hydrolase catalytic domain [Clostridia bacterium]